MEFPTYDERIAVCGSNAVHQAVLDQKFVQPLIATGFPCKLLKQYTDEDEPAGRFIYVPSWLHFYVNKQFIIEDYDKSSDGWNLFYKPLSDIFTMYSSTFTGSDYGNVRGAMFSFYYAYKGHILMFQLQSQTAKLLLRRTLAIFECILKLETDQNEELNSQIANAYRLKDSVFFFNYSGKNWELIDPILAVAAQINADYLGQADKRVNKPDIILHKDFPDKRFTFGDQWVLEFGGLSTLMIRPNDISLYSNIAEKSLEKAIHFHNGIIMPRFKHANHGTFPSQEIQNEYYDYFELITTALIFAFTALEAFANSIIPNNIELEKADGSVHTKTNIEWYSMEEKLTVISQHVLMAPAPQEQNWWARLKTLQNIRNQSIHTRQSDSQVRYSRLLGKDIFNVIGVHKEVILFYGNFIAKNVPDMINSFPYGFGQDQVIPATMSDKTYREMYNSLHNPSTPL
ncbi:MAG: hypothetical protein MUP99_15490 [Pedobacter sp.]|nr:hypothetical protein [Pedobacter sp.]